MTTDELIRLILAAKSLEHLKHMLTVATKLEVERQAEEDADYDPHAHLNFIGQD